MHHNRIAARVICSVLDERGWTEARLGKEAAMPQPLISMHISGKRPIQAGHLMKYLASLNHSERPGLLAAWLRDNVSREVAEDLLAIDGNLGLDVKEWLPTLNEANKRMLSWWAREIERDGELHELFKLLSAKAGYRPRRTATGLDKRRRRRAGGGAVVALLIFVSMLAPAPFPHARQGRAPSFAFGRRQCFLLAAAQAA